VIEVKASGLYQMDRSAFAGQLGDRDWRGAIQTSGHFTPIETWSAGWSYAAFTDNAYLSDYELTDAKSSINQVYATHLSDDTYFDARIQRFNRIGNVPVTDDMQQGLILPRIEGEHVYELAPGLGRVHVNGELLGVQRGMDQTGTYSGVPYVHGYEGTKYHAMLEGAWENQFILPGGLAATPYLGARLDAAMYDRTAAALPAPYATQADAVLFNATPIAALDVRWPLMASDGDNAHLFEPIAQVVYRGSNVTNVGITNDDAHSFVFDTSNLFSYNRFTGIDRQETGLRANIGGHYLGTFEDGSWLDLVAGQSFHLAGVNALGVSDAVQVGTATGLGAPASFIVASARGGFSGGLSGGAKVQIDPSLWRITRAGTGMRYAPGSWYSLGVDYIYIRANPALGIPLDEHEIAASATLGPFFDYYSFNGGLTWDLRTNSWMKANVGAGYDDGYLGVSGGLNFTPTSWGFGFGLQLKGPDGAMAF
jgi:LPS-assembly protein